MRRVLLTIMVCMLQLVSLAQLGWKEYADSLIYYNQRGNLQKAIYWGELATIAAKEKFGAESLNYINFAGLLAGLYQKDQQTQKAIPLIEEAISVYKKKGMTNDEKYSVYLSVLSGMYSSLGQDEKAIPILEETAAAYLSRSGRESTGFTKTQQLLGKAYLNAGRFSKAEPLFREAVITREKLFGKQSEEYINAISALGLLYNDMGNFSKAQSLLSEARRIYISTGDTSSTGFARSLNNLGALYYSLQLYEDASFYYREAARIFAERESTSSPSWLTCASNIASCYRIQGSIVPALQLVRTIRDIRQKKLPRNHPSLLKTQLELADLFLLNDQPDSAGKLFRYLDTAYQTTFGKTSAAYANLLNDMARYYSSISNYTEAESYYIQALSISRSLYGEQHAETMTVMSNLAALYEKTDPKKSVALLKQVIPPEIKEMAEVLSALTPEEKDLYLLQRNRLNSTLNSFLYKHPDAGQDLVKMGFDLQLMLKGLALTGTRELTDMIAQTKDSSQLALTREWIDIKKNIARLRSRESTVTGLNIATLEYRASEIERNLVALTGKFRKTGDGKQVTLNEVASHLKKDEAAIEFVSFDYYNGKSTDTVMYGAYLVTGNDHRPVFVSLGTERSLRRVLDSIGTTSLALSANLYRGLGGQNTNADFPGDRVYAMIWQPLEKYLAGIRKINYSSAGLLHAIAMHALPVNANQLMIDRYEMRCYSSTREIISTPVENTSQKTALLIGNPSFTPGSKDFPQLNNSQDATDALRKFNTARRGLWHDLPKTAEEVKKISALLRAKKYGVQLLTQKSATEEQLKKLNGHSPRILHIATHGFSFPANTNDTALYSAYTNSSTALFRSGLVLAGANYAWSGKQVPDSMEDGILNAYEVAQLDLRGTELVVLSACETGLGDIQGSEGVYGLQRAFKLAGVQKMIVSLWQVPDKETAELMTIFYTLYSNGTGIEEALRKAQLQMRKKYSPYYWAAFMLI